MMGETRLLRRGLQSALTAVYPPQCILCGEATADAFGLCGTCWREMPFIDGLVCDGCGVPLPGEDEGRAEFCDECLASEHPWSRARAAVRYRDNGRRLVLALKHGDRLDLVRPAAEWLLRAARPLIEPQTVVVPVPLHWTRLVTRRYNQSALLARELAARAGLDHCPDLLIRRRRTKSQEGRDREGRFANVSGAIAPHPRRAGMIAGRPVLVVDDVLTSGATLTAAAEACIAAGASSVAVVVLARVAKDD